MDFEQIKSILPQKYPFIMVDRVLSVIPNQEIICIKNITGNEAIFCGHFPEKAIFPGAYITEALAQASILLFQEMKNEENIFLLYSTKLRFKKQVVPGDQLILKIQASKVTSTGAIVEATALVDDAIAASGEIMFAIQNVKGEKSK